MTTIETERLRLRELDEEDAAFVFELVNDPSWLRHIGDKGVRNLDDARAYIDDGPRASYARHGFGLWCMERKSDAERLGLCGLIRRDTLPDVDIGYALLPRHAGRGYALEAATAVLDHAAHALRLARVLAIVSPANASSIALLGKLGLRYRETLSLGNGDTAVYVRELAGDPA